MRSSLEIASVCALVMAVACAAPWLGTLDPQAVSPIRRLKPPSAQYWFGTDMIGRDVYSRVLYGTRVTDFPHVRRLLADAYVRLLAMKLYSARCSDYERSASADDRRFLLYNPIAKMKVTSEGEQVIDQDETPMQCDLAKIPNLKPAFRKDGTVTAANASGINDGAAAVILASEEAVKKYDLVPKARILGLASAGVPPFGTVMDVGEDIKNLVLGVSHGF